MSKLRQNESGQINLENDAIVYSGPAGIWWRLPIADLGIVAEYTNDHGPMADDYFFVFVSKNDQSWYEASFYTDGRDDFLVKLGLKLKSELHCKLVYSTDFKSRIMWPPELEGQEMFKFIPEAKSATLLGRLRQRIVPKLHFELSDAAQKALNH